MGDCLIIGSLLKKNIVPESATSLLNKGFWSATLLEYLGSVADWNPLASDDGLL